MAMDPQDSKQLALQKAINSHEQAAAGVRDLNGGRSDGKYASMLERIERNIAELNAELADSKPEDPVQPE